MTKLTVMKGDEIIVAESNILSEQDESDSDY
jgi:hypothetical protein